MIALQVNEKDNVAVVFGENVRKDDVIDVRDCRGCITKVLACSDIPYGHKIAVKNIRKAEAVIKYGEVIGGATEDISVGSHVHVHNMESLRARGDWKG